MNINVSNLVLTLQQKIDSSSSEADVLYYAKAIEQLRSGKVFVADKVSDLPSHDQAPGSLYYIHGDESVYFASEFGWALIYNNSISPIFSWGGNNCGQLGIGSRDTCYSPVQEYSRSTNWCQVSVGADHTSAIKTSGEIWSWGNGVQGLLGDGTGTEKCSPVREFCSATDWCQVSGGFRHTSAVKTSGELWSWGCGTCGRMGDGLNFNRNTPTREICSATDWCQVSAKGYHTSAIKTSGQLWTWGSNLCFALGNGTAVSSCSPVREFCSATNWCQVANGCCVTYAIKTSGELWAWGSNNCGRLGDGSTTSRCSPVRERCSDTSWCQVSSAVSHVAAIKTSGQIWAWGLNSFGQLGDGVSLSRCSPVREFCSATDWCQVAAGNAHTAAVKTSGQLWAWGVNSCGRLGDGTVVDRCSPVREISSSTNWCQVCAGNNQTAAILSKTI